MENALKLSYDDRVQKILTGELTDLASFAFTAVERTCLSGGIFYNEEELTEKHSKKRASIRVDDTYMLTLLPKNNISLVKLTGEDLNTNISYLLEAIWIPYENIGGWQMDRKQVRSLDQIKDFIDRLTEEGHKIELVLPWKSEIDFLQDDEFEDDEVDEFVQHIIGITNGEITLPKDSFKLEICEFSENFGPDCEYYRFQKMIKDLTATTNWVYTFGDGIENTSVVSGEDVDWNTAKESDPGLINRPYLYVSALQGGFIAPTGEVILNAQAHNAGEEDLRLLQDYLLKYSITWENNGQKDLFQMGDPEALRWNIWYEAD